MSIVTLDGWGVNLAGQLSSHGGCVYLKGLRMILSFFVFTE